VTDITYIRIWQGWLYLAVVMDLFSRMIVGRAARPTIHRELVLNAVLMAVRRRGPRGTLIHSDQGTQFGSDAWRRFCRSNHLEPSMSRKGNCRDNAVAESFSGSLKKERIKKQKILGTPPQRTGLTFAPFGGRISPRPKTRTITCFRYDGAQFPPIRCLTGMVCVSLFWLSSFSFAPPYRPSPHALVTNRSRVRLGERPSSRCSVEPSLAFNPQL
jgi:transposase InsO family protein